MIIWDIQAIFLCYTESMESQVLDHTAFDDLQTLIPALYTKRQELSSRLRRAQLLLFLLTPFGFILGPRKEKKTQEVAELHKLLDGAVVSVTYPKDQVVSWNNVYKSYRDMSQSKRIWKLVKTTTLDSAEERTPAQIGRVRRSITLEHKNIPYIKSDQSPLMFPFSSGEIYLYPSFSVMINDSSIFVDDIGKIQRTYEALAYIEEDPLPKDATILRYTWKKANVDGSPDKRFSDNFQIPILRYGMITVELDDKHERYVCSNADAAEHFVSLYMSYAHQYTT